MTTPTTGVIGVSHVNTEIGLVATTPNSLNDPTVRDLADVPTGPIDMSNLRGKSRHIVASGGTITEYSVGEITYRVHTFLSSGVFNISRLGSIHNGLEVLSVGGGGAGGFTGTPGGGGGGGLVNVALTPAVGNYNITVGAGGITGGAAAGATIISGNWSDSRAGGGAGGSNNSAGGAGASGGGASHLVFADGNASNNDIFRAGGTATDGYPGGSRVLVNSSFRIGAAGGGGYGGPGTSQLDDSDGGRRVGETGGPGWPSAIRTGVVQYYAAGGAGDGTGGVGGSLGGSGVGGTGGSDANGAGTAGVANSGSGGGGRNNGGAGIVVFKYRVS